ncbi:hypothetical protein LTR27_006719 [Elasticomyces elasticus]|nr:hypothetical protein LTR27_006719 [Elasticomyces elasticus]
MLRDLSATYWQSRNSFRAQQWNQVPQILRSMLVVAVLMAQSIRSGTNLPRIYKYRSHVIKDLKDYLQRQSEQTPAILLALTLGMLLQEIHLQPIGGFSIHLIAARRVVESCGGVGRCLQIWPLPLNIIVMFVHRAEIISATTSHARYLTADRIEEQYRYVAAFDNFETIC